MECGASIELVRSRIEDFHKPICFGGKEKSVAVEVNRKMIEITLLQSG